MVHYVTDQLRSTLRLFFLPLPRIYTNMDFQTHISLLLICCCFILATSAKNENDLIHTRTKRAEAKNSVTIQERIQLIKIHNYFRQQANASNMNHLVSTKEIRCVTFLKNEIVRNSVLINTIS